MTTREEEVKGKGGDIPQTDISIYILNHPRGQFSEKKEEWEEGEVGEAWEEEGGWGEGGCMASMGPTAQVTGAWERGKELRKQGHELTVSGISGC